MDAPVPSNGLGSLVGSWLFVVGVFVGLAAVGGGDTNLITGCSVGYVDGYAANGMSKRILIRIMTIGWNQDTYGLTY